MSGKKLKQLKGRSHCVKSVCWSPDGKYLASGAWDKTIIIWDANSGEKLKTLDGDSYKVYSVCWSPDGKYLASGSFIDETVIIWDANSGEKLQTLEGHSDIVNSVCWSPDGKYLASGSSQWNGVENIGCIKIWDAIGGKEIQTLHRHSAHVNSVCWSHDGKYLASGSLDGTVIIWSVEDDKETVEINYNSLFKGGRVKKGSGGDAGVGKGDGKGSGPSFSLAGRGAKSWVKPSSSTEKVGNVVVEIKVDKDGNVLEAKAGQRGTTLWDSNLWRLCEQAARKSKFTANPDAPEVQKGTITYIFR
jgi:WD40 repeat protein